jgi:hypothetical protein
VHTRPWTWLVQLIVGAGSSQVAAAASIA